MNLEASIARLLPPSARVRLRLVADNLRELVERRRADCARLSRCEIEWIEVHGSEQARCPQGCASFRPRRAA